VSFTAFAHVICKDVREFGHGKHVQLQHVERFLERLIDETSIKAITGVAHQDVDVQPTRVKAGFQFSTSACHCKVHSFDDDVHAALLPKVLGQLLHRFPATRNEHEVCVLLRQKRGKLDAESTGRTGNESPLAAYVVHHSLLVTAQQNADNKNRETFIGDPQTSRRETLSKSQQQSRGSIDANFSAQQRPDKIAFFR